MALPGNRQYPGGGWRSAWNPSAAPAVLELDRRSMFTGTLALTTAKAYGMGGLTAPAGKPLSSISLWATAAGTVTGRWVAAVRLSDGMIMGVSTNAGSAFNLNAITTQSFAAAWTPTVDTPFYVAFGIVASVVPTLIASAAGANTTFLAQAPVFMGTFATAATTTPPTIGTSPLGALTAIAQMPWAAVN